MSISNSFTITTVEDGKSAPFYHDQRYGWSAYSSVQNYTTPPSDIASWSENVPQPVASKPFLWLKDVLMVLNSSNEYEASSTTYTRINGEDGKGIQIKGSVVAVESSTSSFPTTGVSSGDLALLISSAYVYRYNGSSWSAISAAATTGDGYIYQGDGYIWVWNDTIWQRGGQIKGDPGVSQYIHVAWAHQLGTGTDWTGQNTGFTVSKSASAKYEYIGICVNNDANDDPPITRAGEYTWDEVEGVGGVSYQIESSLGGITIPSNNTTTTISTLDLSFWKKLGDGTREAFQCYYVAFRRKGTSYVVIGNSSVAQSSVTMTNVVVSESTHDAISICLFDSYASNRSHTGYLYEMEIPVIKQGDNSFVLDLNNETDTMLYSADGTTIIGDKPTTTWTLYKGGTDITSQVTSTPSFNDVNCVAAWTSTTNRTLRIESMTASAGYVDINVTYGGINYTSRFSVKKLSGVDKYEIISSPNAITYNSTNSASSGPTSVNVTIYKTEANTGIRSRISSLSGSGVYLWVNSVTRSGGESLNPVTDGASGYNGTSGYTFTADTTKAAYHVVLRNTNSTSSTANVLDSETIPISKSADGNGITSIANAYAISSSSISTNEDTPPSGLGSGWVAVAPSPTDAYPYIWRRVTTTYTVQDSTTKYYLSGAKGADGSDSISIDLTNEMDSLVLNNVSDGSGRGVVTSTTTISTNVLIYKGSTPQTLTRILVNTTLPSGVSETHSINGTQGNVNITFNSGSALPNDRLDIIIQATCSSGTLTGILSIVGIRGNAIYKLIPSVSSISTRGTSYTPYRVSCYVEKIANGIATANPSEITMGYILSSYEGEQSYTPNTEILSSRVSTELTFVARLGGNIVDRETVPLVKGSIPPNYNLLSYAWSQYETPNDPENYPYPTDIDIEDWVDSEIPAQPPTKPYLWMRNTLMEYATATESYIARTRTYVRITGESGVGVKVKGKVVAYEATYAELPTGVASGSLAILEGYPTIYLYQNSNWSSYGTATTSDCYILENDGPNDGHLFVWNDVNWVDVGYIRGTAGANAYVHFAWCNDLTNYSGFTTSRPAGAAYKYIGVLADNTYEDSQTPTDYSWSEVEGAPATRYEILLDEAYCLRDTSGVNSAFVYGHTYLWTGRMVRTFRPRPLL